MPLTAKRLFQDLVDIVGVLGGAWSGHMAMCRCLAHADSDPSLSIRRATEVFSSAVSQDAPKKTQGRAGGSTM